MAGFICGRTTAVLSNSSFRRSPSAVGSSKSRRRGKFYTNRSVAKALKERTFALLGPQMPEHVIEPSAGSGSFLNPEDGIVPFDLHPDQGLRPDLACRILHPDQLGFAVGADGSLDQDFLEILRDEVGKGENLLALGNPPFGKNSGLAVAFVNEFLRVGGVVAFVLPNGLCRWSVQKKVRKDARLIAEWAIPETAFHLPKGKPYKIQCVFQIWSIRSADQHHPDLRMTKRPPTSHPDFEMRRWNREDHHVPGHMEQVFDWDFDFAVRCQGYGDYRYLLLPGSCPTDGAHYMMFKGHTAAAKARLGSLDFHKLSRTQTITPGFGKADVVRAYDQARGTMPNNQFLKKRNAPTVLWLGECQ